MPIAAIADIVGSRLLADREAAQRALDEAIDRVERDLPVSERRLRPTVGDEQQGVYASLDAALASLLLIQLALPDGIQCRFGLGIGPMESVPSASGGIPDGPGWWAARAAIDTVHRMQQRAAPTARTWVGAAPGLADGIHVVNAYLLARDEIVAGMAERTRRLAYGRCFGATQRDLAEREGVTQSAVSQALATAGAHAVVQGFGLLRQSL
ncbi:MAG: SatD family protein [Microbacterium sp.]|uniref:SatD family protein n=1 Tax=Microbacterium sp. TaxID=51671 RepID=UPI0039E31EA1